jgi:hypothetical protein
MSVVVPMKYQVAEMDAGPNRSALIAIEIKGL